jgi:hypothetical protein
MNNEVEKLLSLIYQGGQIKVENGQLLVAPVEIARKFGDQIRRLKPEILLALGHCPICAKELVNKIEKDFFEKTGRHAYCSESQHYDSWKF